jgi:N-acetyl sugar amidotransferase
VRYCGHCVLPDTRPGLELGPDGVCSACRSRGRRVEVDWDARRRRFHQLAAEVRELGRPYDCVIPVSGGKDSTWQTVTCLEAGLRPLAVTWRPPGRTPLGEANLRNLVELGVDHIDFSISPRVERAFTLKAFERYGSNALPMHMAIFNVPLTIAARFDVPLVVWGEDSAVEYSGMDIDRSSFRLDSEWVRRYGVVHGTTAADWVDDELTRGDLTPYFGPTDTELRDKGIDAVFLGWFFEWDPERTASVAAAHGLRTREEGPRTGLYDHTDIDDEFISIHHWMKWPKFGFTRTWDNLALEIRAGRITRDEAIATLAARGDETPHSDIATFCDWVGITRERFDATVERFRDPDVWTRRRDGSWAIEDFLVPGWSWTEATACAA